MLNEKKRDRASECDDRRNKDREYWNWKDIGEHLSSEQSLLISWHRHTHKWECKWWANGQTNHNDNRTMIIYKRRYRLKWWGCKPELFLVFMRVQCAWQTVYVRIARKIAMWLKMLFDFEIDTQHFFVVRLSFSIHDIERTDANLNPPNGWWHPPHLKQPKWNFWYVVIGPKYCLHFSTMGYNHNFSCIFIAVPPFLLQANVMRWVVLCFAMCCVSVSVSPAYFVFS